MHLSSYSTHIAFSIILAIPQLKVHGQQLESLLLWTWSKSSPFYYCGKSQNSTTINNTAHFLLPTFKVNFVLVQMYVHIIHELDLCFCVLVNIIVVSMCCYIFIYIPAPSFRGCGKLGIKMSRKNVMILTHIFQFFYILLFNSCRATLSG